IGVAGITDGENPRRTVQHMLLMPGWKRGGIQCAHRLLQLARAEAVRMPVERGGECESHGVLVHVVTHVLERAERDLALALRIVRMEDRLQRSVQQQLETTIEMA